MTKPVECKTARRIMPVSEWPSEDRAAWETALLPGDDLEEGGIRASHSGFSNSSQAKDYGRWLAWLKSRDLLDPHAAAVDRITRDRIRSFLADLAKHNSTATIINRLTGLKAVATVLDPEGDWAWINRAVSFVRARHRPARPSRERTPRPSA